MWDTHFKVSIAYLIVMSGLIRSDISQIGTYEIHLTLTDGMRPSTMFSSTQHSNQLSCSTLLNCSACVQPIPVCLVCGILNSPLNSRWSEFICTIGRSCPQRCHKWQYTCSRWGSQCKGVSVCHNVGQSTILTAVEGHHPAFLEVNTFPYNHMYLLSTE